MPPTICIAIGRNTHVVVRKTDTGKADKQPVSNSYEGLMSVYGMAVDDKTVPLLMTGNKQWGTDFACGLLNRGILVNYVAKPTQKGARENLPKFAERVLIAGDVFGHPFTADKRPTGLIQEPHQWYTLCMQYHSATDTVREQKHLVLSTLVRIFPEAVRPPYAEVKKAEKQNKPMPEPLPRYDIWTKKMLRVLANPDPYLWQLDTRAGEVPIEIIALAKKSLGLEISEEAREHYLGLHAQHLANLRTAEETKEYVYQALFEAVSDHALVVAFPDSVIAVTLAGFLGWRTWQKWEWIRSFCGLAVDRFDGEKHHVNGKRPEIRQALYLLATLTTKGKEFSHGKTHRIKRIETVLRELHKAYLR